MLANRVATKGVLFSLSLKFRGNSERPQPKGGALRKCKIEGGGGRAGQQGGRERDGGGRLQSGSAAAAAPFTFYYCYPW